MGSDVVVMHAVVSWNSGCADSIAFLTGRRRICLGITNSSEMQPFENGRSSFEDGAGRSCQQGGTHDCESKPWDRHVAIAHHCKSQEHHIIGQHGISARNVFSRASCLRGTTLKCVAPLGGNIHGSNDVDILPRGSLPCPVRGVPNDRCCQHTEERWREKAASSLKSSTVLLSDMTEQQRPFHLVELLRVQPARERPPLSSTS